MFSRLTLPRRGCFPRSTAILICGLILLAGCRDAPSPSYFPLSESLGGWRLDTSDETIKKQGFDPQKLKLWAQWNRVLPNGTFYQSSMLIKQGWVISEAYSSYSKGHNHLYPLASNGKSFSLALLGKMFEQSQTGEIPFAITPQSKLYDKRWLIQGFPLSDPLKADISFGHLMQHKSGLQPEIGLKYDNERGRRKTKNYQDWVFGRDQKYPLTAKVFFSPGSPILEDLDPYWRAYSSVAFAHLSFVFKNVYQIPAHKVLEQNLLSRIGIEHLDYYLPPDPANGITWFSAGGVELTMRNYARFAYLVLNNGRWNDKQIIPEQWVARLSQSTDYPNWRSNRDGYFGNEYPEDMVRIFGAGGNFAFIIPSMGMVAIHNGYHPKQLVKGIESTFLKLLFDAYLGNDS